MDPSFYFITWLIGWIFCAIGVPVIFAYIERKQTGYPPAGEDFAFGVMMCTMLGLLWPIVLPLLILGMGMRKLLIKFNLIR